MTKRPNMDQPPQRRRIFLVSWKRNGNDAWRSKTFLTGGRAREFAQWLSEDIGFPVILDELHVESVTRHSREPFGGR